MKPSSIYLTVSQNRNEILSKLKATFNINTIEIEKEKLDYENDVELKSESSKECDDFEPNFQSIIMRKIEFDLNIPYENYCKMKPVSVVYGKRHESREVLKQGAWTNIVFDHLHKTSKLPCCFVFKICKVFSPSADIFLKLFAKCKDVNCKANLYAFAKNKPLEDEPLKLKVITSDTKNIPHNSSIKRYLNGKKRKEIGKELQNQYSSLWQRDEANRKMEFGDNMPPNLYNTNVLRKAKQEFRDSKLGIEINNPVMSLIELKHTIPFAGSIHLISADPFIVHYWTPTQMILYKDACISDNKSSRLCIDATGSVVKKLYRTSQLLKSSHIFLYVAVLNNGTIQFPVCQMLSESQDTPTITYWLSR